MDLRLYRDAVSRVFALCVVAALLAGCQGGSKDRAERSATTSAVTTTTTTIPPDQMCAGKASTVSADFDGDGLKDRARRDYQDHNLMLVVCLGSGEESSVEVGGMADGG